MTRLVVGAKEYRNGGDLTVGGQSLASPITANARGSNGSAYTPGIANPAGAAPVPIPNRAARRRAAHARRTR